jgi:ectoine hydroxylase-related dioxygenase (phytanoyl-CoA dioxygenase family)
MSITSEQLRQFEEDGFLILDQILTAEQTEQTLAAVHRVFRGQYTHDRRPSEYQNRFPSYPEHSEIAKHWVNGRLLDDALWDISTDPRLGAMAATLLQTPSVSLMEDQLFEKTPGGRPVAMHQDATYLPFLRTWDVVNCWMALTDTTEDMAPLLLIRGSHKWGLVEKPTKFSDGDEEDMLEVVEAVRPPGAKVEMVPTVVPAGGGVFHHARMIHGSHCNHSNRTRTAYTLHYAAESCRVRTGRWPANYEPYVVDGLKDGDRLTTPYMPIVYSAKGWKRAEAGGPGG